MPAPALNAGHVLDLCTGGIQSALDRDAMAAIRGHVVSLATEYASLAPAGNLHLLASQGAGIGVVSGGKLEANYTERMMPKKSAGRPVYDALKDLPPHDRCPLCGFGRVETLDHVLPKAQYPGLPLRRPTSWVPACAAM